MTGSAQTQVEFEGTGKGIRTSAAIRCRYTTAQRPIRNCNKIQLPVVDSQTRVTNAARITNRDQNRGLIGPQRTEPVP